MSRIPTQKTYSGVISTVSITVSIHTRGHQLDQERKISLGFIFLLSLFCSDDSCSLCL